MKYLLILPLLIASISASAASATQAWEGKERKPEQFDQSQMMGSAKKMQFEQAVVPMAKPEQFEAALQAVRQIVIARGAAEGKEASEDGTNWFTLDHDPHGFNELENYDVVEILKTHNRNYSTFAVRSRLNGYNAQGGWAWHSAKVRYIAYVRDDGKVLAVKEDNFSNLIDFMESKYAQEEKDTKRAKAMKPVGYSREAEEAEQVSSNSAL